MKGNKANKEDVSAKETRKPCGKCKWYDHETERQFHRKVGPVNEKGERTLIVEPRAVCRGSKARAKGHLVHRDQTKRPCEQWKAGKYVKPEQKEEKKKDEEKSSPEEYFGTPEGRLKEQKKKPKELAQLEKLIEKAKKSKTSVEKNKLNGEKKTLTVKRGKVTVK